METWHANPAVAPATKLAELVYELLDAHDDTLRLSQDRVGEEPWAAHVDYLRQLQRIGRETLAQATQLTDAAPPAPAPGSATPGRSG